MGLLWRLVCCWVPNPITSVVGSNVTDTLLDRISCFSAALDTVLAEFKCLPPLVQLGTCHCLFVTAEGADET